MNLLCIEEYKWQFKRVNHSLGRLFTTCTVRSRHVVSPCSCWCWWCRLETVCVCVCLCVCVCVCVYSRPGLGEAHGQQHVQSGPVFDGARPALALPPRGHFGVHVVFRCHISLLLHQCVRSSAPLAYLHRFRIKKRSEVEAGRSRRAL